MRSQDLQRVPTHPGEVLEKEFLEPLAITRLQLAAHLGIPVRRIHGIVRGRRAVKPETAWLFAQAMGTSPEFWLALQASHDLAKTKPRRRVKPLRKR